MDDQTVRKFARLSHVPRWTVVPTIRKQSVAEHTFNVLWITKYLRSQLPSVYFDNDILSSALSHDLDEAVTGDVPAPNKQHKPLASLSEIELLVKCADTLEAVMFTHEEILMGNLHWMHSIHRELSNKFSNEWAELLLRHNDENAPVFVRMSRANDVLLAFLNRVFGGVIRHQDMKAAPLSIHPVVEANRAKAD